MTVKRDRTIGLRWSHIDGFPVSIRLLPGRDQSCVYRGDQAGTQSSRARSHQAVAFAQGWIDDVRVLDCLFEVGIETKGRRGAACSSTGMPCSRADRNASAGNTC